MSAFATRALDIVVAGMLLVALSPVLLVSVLMVRAGTPGPIMHRAVRVGRDGRFFTLYKLRTMVADAAVAGPAVTSHDDERITWAGQRLRAKKLDELPQLWNVLKGDMSLVGPRPEDPRYVRLYNEQQREVLCVRPGITSPASVAFVDEARQLGSGEIEARYVTSVMPAKLRIELDYLAHRTLRSDLRVLIATLAAITRRRRAT